MAPQKPNADATAGPVAPDKIVLTQYVSEGFCWAVEPVSNELLKVTIVCIDTPFQSFRY